MIQIKYKKSPLQFPQSFSLKLSKYQHVIERNKCFMILRQRCIIMQNMIIENEFDAHGSIVDLNVMFVREVDMIVDKTKQFQ